MDTVGQPVMTNRRPRRKDMDRGKDAYWLRKDTRLPWDVLAVHCGYKSGRGCMKAAQQYSINHNYPWPLKRYTKGAAIYKSRRIGISWQRISQRLGMTVTKTKRCAYLYARRHSWVWPPKENK